MTTALSTTLVTPFGHDLTVLEGAAIAAAQTFADRNGAPCGVWERDGWFTVCEIAPDEIEPNPELFGWVLWAIVNPTTVFGECGR